MNDSEFKKDDKDDDKFAMPSNYTIKPQIKDGITQKELSEWRSLGNTKPHSASHVAVIYLNPVNDKLYVAFHERSAKLKNGGCKLGWPGGIADHKGETIFASTVRELREECFSKTKLNERDLHLLYVKRMSDNPLQIYAQFVLFINDLSLLTGPDKDNEWELQENEAFGMTKKNGYHNFFALSVNQDTNRVEVVDAMHKIESSQFAEVTKKIWNHQYLKRVRQCIKYSQDNDNKSLMSCRFYGSARGCRHGKSCMYGHHNPFSICLCRDLDEGCAYGDKCRYRHQTMSHLSKLDISKEIVKISQRHCDLVFGYFRANDQRNKQNTPDGIVNICLLFAFRVFFESSMLTREECDKLHQMICDHRNIYSSEWKLLYRGSRDGYKMIDCHPKCYSKENVVVILKTKVGNIFGGFTKVGWDLNAETDEYRADPNAFLFLIRAKTHSNKLGIWKIKDHLSKKAVYHYKMPGNAWLFLFGRGGTDLNAIQDCDKKCSSGSSIYCFERKDYSDYDAFNGSKGTGGAYTVDELECFQLWQSEQNYGQYDVIISPDIAPFLNYSLISNLLKSDQNLQYHSPRIHWNETKSIIYPPTCSSILSNQQNGCSINISTMNNTLCGMGQLEMSSIWLIDFEKESFAELGRSFDLKNTPNYGEVILPSSTADKLGIESVGETIHISLPLNSSHVPLLANYLNDKYFTKERNLSIESPDLLTLIDECNSVIIPLNVSYISEKSLGGKFSELHTAFDAVINIHHFMQMFFDNLPNKISEKIRTDLDENHTKKLNPNSINDYIKQIYINLPPNRITTYLSTNYKVILSKLVTFAGKIRYKIGWNEVKMNLDILESMSLVSYTVLSLSIVLDMIIFVLILLSIGLLYSLLVISVDSKKFMLGILRMLGMTKKSLVCLLVSQSLGYSIPAYISGLLLAQIGVIYVCNLLGSAGNVKLDASLSTTAIIISTSVGIGCSLIAAILPIISALQQNLRDVLDVRHSQTKAVKFNINRSDNYGAFSWNILLVCSVLVIFGWIIYYFLPQAFLSGNLAQISIMLFSLLLAMLFGFILIGMNTQHVIERIIVKFMLFWEKNPIPNIVIKNLIAHRIRNRKTAMMYSLSLSFIFLVTIMVGSNIEYMKENFLRTHASKLRCGVRRSIATHGTYGTNLSTHITLHDLESFLSGNGNFSDVSSNETIHQFIDDFAYRPFSFRKDHHGATTFYMQAHFTNIGRYYSTNGLVFGVAPNFERTAVKRFVHQTKGFATTMSGSELFYTAAGSQRMAVGSYVANYLKLESLDDRLVLKYTNGDHNGKDDYRLVYKSLGWYSLYPHYGLWDFDYGGSSALISMSSAPRLFEGVESVEDLWMWVVFIKLKSNVVKSEISQIKSRLEPYCASVFDFNEFSSKIDESASMLDLIFSMNTWCALFLCLFSLVASMSTNIMEQTKEIGIFRSMGLTKFEINKIYIFEAMVLILSSSLIGMLIGSVLCFVVLQQQALFTNYPVHFEIPQSVLGACISGAIGTSVLSVWFPLKRLNTKQIAQSLREFL